MSPLRLPGRLLTLISAGSMFALSGLWNHSHSYAADMRRHHHLLCWLFCLCTASLYVSGCTKKGEGADEAVSGTWAPVRSTMGDLRNAPGTVFDVAFNPNMVHLDLESARRTLRSISSDGDVFVFEDSDPRIHGLAEGKILFIENLSIRRIVAVARKDSLMVVGTEPGALPDLIQRGTIRWKVPVDFGTLAASARPGADPENETPLWSLLFSPRTIYARGTGMSFSGKVDGWNANFEVSPSPNRLDMTVHVDNNIDELALDFTAKGFLKDFVSSGNMHIQDGSVDSFDFSNTGVNGVMNVDWSATRGEGSTAGMEKPNIKLPPLAKIPDASLRCPIRLDRECQPDPETWIRG